MNAEQSGDADRVARSVFAGLVPTVPLTVDPAPRPAGERSSLSKGLFATLPIVLVGSMAAMTINLAGAVEPANAKPAKPKGMAGQSGRKLPTATVETAPTTVQAPAPNLYDVAAGDTVSDIAGRYGLSTASVLALNGLSWSSLIFPGQRLKLTA